ncbi:transcriptional regulator [Leptospira meyeri]|nr:transcriptional regulator [Leptospira meyeri]
MSGSNQIGGRSASSRGCTFLGSEWDWHYRDGSVPGSPLLEGEKSNSVTFFPEWTKPKSGRFV